MAKPNMPNPLATGAPTWDGRPHTLRDFIWRLDWQFEVSGITADDEKLKWAVSYVEPSIRDEWSSFAEYTTPNWTGFQARLKKEYPELVLDEQGSVSALRSLCGRFKHISQYDEERLLDFKRKFSALANKCLAAPALVTNRELVEMFVGSLDKHFQDNLNTRLSTSGTLRAGAMVRDEDPYDWTEVVTKAVDLVSGKSISKAFKTETTESTSRSVPAQVKRESVERSIDRGHSDLREEIAIIKDTLAINQKSMQSFMDSMKATIQSKVSRPASSGSYNQGQSRQNNEAGAGTSRCFYCYENGHRWVICPSKDQDQKDGKIKVDGNQLRFADGSPIPRIEGMSIKAIVAKYLPSSLLVCLGMQPELPQHEDIQDIDPISYARIPEISIYTNQLRDTRDNIIDESRQALDKRGLELENVKGRLNALEALLTKATSSKPKKPKEPEPLSSDEDSEPDGLASQLAKILALAQKKDLSKKTQSGF
jgi:hypothetical protein